MLRHARSIHGGLVYHILNRANARMTLFEKEEKYTAFERKRGDGQVRGGAIAATRRQGRSWPLGRSRDRATGEAKSTAPKRRPNWTRCVDPLGGATVGNSSSVQKNHPTTGPRVDRSPTRTTPQDKANAIKDSRPLLIPSCRYQCPKEARGLWKLFPGRVLDRRRERVAWRFRVINRR